MTEILRDSLMDVGKSVVGVSIAKAMKIPEKLDMGDSFAMVHGSNGVLYTLISDVIDYASTGESKMMKLDVYGLGDNIVFLSALSAGAEVTQADKMVYDVLNKQAGLSRDASDLITESAILSAGRITGRLIEETPGMPTWLNVIRHPSNVRNYM